MSKEAEEQADFMRVEDEGPDLGRVLRGLGPPRFNDSFIERRSRLYQQRSDYMDRIIRVQRDIEAIEHILGS